jgi:hypothetical protein
VLTRFRDRGNICLCLPRIGSWLPQVAVFCHVDENFVPVAQLDRASASVAEGRIATTLYVARHLHEAEKDVVLSMVLY